MKRWKASIIAICICTTVLCQEKVSIGTDISETIRNGNVKIQTSFAFTRHWTVETSTSFRIPACRNGNGISETGDYWSEMAFRHWKDGCFNGISVAFGAVRGFTKETDITISIGYSISIWKGISINMGYGIRVFDTIKGKDPKTDGISIEICYRFQR